MPASRPARPGESSGWRWDFGDGATAEGPTVEHAYEKAGPYVRPAVDRDRCHRQRMQRHGGAALRGRQRAAGRRCRRGPPGRGRPGGPVRRLARSRDPDGAIIVMALGLRRRHHRVGHERPPSLPRERRLPGHAHRDRRHRRSPNNRASATVMVTVNAPPEPVIAAPAAVCPAEVVAFDGGQSRDADGAIEQLRLALRRRRRRRRRRGHPHLRSARPATRSRSWPTTAAGLNNSRQQTHPRSPRQPAAAADGRAGSRGLPGRGRRLRRRRFDRLGRRAGALPLGLRRRHHGGRRAGGPQLRPARRLPGPADGHRRFRRELRHGHRYRAGARQRAAGRGRRRRSPGLRRRRLRPAAVRRLGRRPTPTASR